MSAGAPTAQRPLRVLVVDDSAYNRRNIGDILASSVEIEVVGKAADGEEALRLATNLRPDVVTLDLEMPRMDGFTFLRILMSRQPTPVIVISSLSQRENVFKALELGALDFVARRTGDSGAIRDELIAKVNVVRALRPMPRPAAVRPAAGNFQSAPTPVAMQAPSAGGGARAGVPAAPQGVPRPAPTPRLPPRKLVVIASST